MFSECGSLTETYIVIYIMRFIKKTLWTRSNNQIYEKKSHNRMRNKDMK